MKKKLIRIVTLMLTCSLIVSTVVYLCNAYEETTYRSYVFTYNAYDDIDGELTFDSPIFDNLWAMGYDADEYLNNSASSVYSVMQSAELLFFIHHGGPGYVLCYDPLIDEISSICADRNNAEYLHSCDRAVSDLTYPTTKTNKLTIYFACNAGVTPDPIEDESQLTGYIYPANLVTTTVQRASKCSIGWTAALYVNSTEPWFTYFTMSSESHSIADSVALANRLMYDNYGTIYSSRLAQYIIRGTSSQILGE